MLMLVILLKLLILAYDRRKIIYINFFLSVSFIIQERYNEKLKQIA